ncbi:hypothetical protein So717_16170 [Roseobacter cerasinus]|uniref:J domain-containing protein n=1 Tax=Roseobacter cerasinus TaxID=2602289 RepID=A0A640VQH5_9RHOB|nr:DnaJ domain-containing protein [Roseobacter cerasinus]GFE49864.1 hypothetical protein So717_16170 [Roseobacter cerasinus]
MAATPEHAARVLGLDDHATLEDVRRVRRALARKYHPDHAADRASASRHMARINAAVDTLVAHLKEQAAKPKQAAQDDKFAAKRKAASETFRAAAEKAAQQAREQTQQRARASSQRRESTRQTAHRHTATARTLSSDERALAQAAASSYRSVLDRIGKMAVRPSVDTRVMCFSRTA